MTFASVRFSVHNQWAFVSIWFPPDFVFHSSSHWVHNTKLKQDTSYTVTENYYAFSPDGLTQDLHGTCDWQISATVSNDFRRTRAKQVWYYGHNKTWYNQANCFAKRIMMVAFYACGYRWALAIFYLISIMNCIYFSWTLKATAGHLGARF